MEKNAIAAAYESGNVATIQKAWCAKAKASCRRMLASERRILKMSLRELGDIYEIDPQIMREEAFEACPLIKSALSKIEGAKKFIPVIVEVAGMNPLIIEDVMTEVLFDEDVTKESVAAMAQSFVNMMR